MGLARSPRWKVLVTLVAAAGFVWLLEATMFDSRFSMLPLSFESADPSAAPVPGARVAFSSTAYCKGLVTSSGVAVQKGVMAADPGILPVGSVIDFNVGNPTYDGIYTILDHIQQARAAGFAHLYLGYWIPGSEKMDYKASFRPLELLLGGDWRPYEPIRF